MLPHVTAPACRPTTPTPQRFSTKSCHGLGSRTARGVSSVDFVTTTRAVSRVVWTGSVVTLRCLVVVRPLAIPRCGVRSYKKCKEQTTRVGE